MGKGKGRPRARVRVRVMDAGFRVEVVDQVLDGALLHCGGNDRDLDRITPARLKTTLLSIHLRPHCSTLTPQP